MHDVAEAVAARGLPPGTTLAQLIDHERVQARLAGTFDALAAIRARHDRGRRLQPHLHRPEREHQAMTDRLAAFVVVLDTDVREDDPLAHALRESISLLRGVAAVRPVVADGELRIAEARADQVWRGRLLALVRDPAAVDQITRDGMRG